MGKLLSISVGILAVIGSHFFLSSQSSIRATDENLAATQYEILARDAAIAGYNIAKLSLSESFTSNTVSAMHDNASVNIVIKVSGDIANVLSTGTIIDATGEELDYGIKAKFQRTMSALPENPPAFMDYAVLTDQDLHLNGNVSTGVVVAPGSVSELNSNMHTNGNLTISGSSASVGGFGSYSGSASSDPITALYTTFKPAENPDLQPTSFHADPIAIPTFDMDTFTSSIDVDQYSSGSELLNGHYDFGGTRSNPHVWHIEGNLNISGSTVIDGYNIFLVDGDFDIKGELLAGDSGWSTTSESSIGIYTSGSVDVSGNNTIEAQIFAGGNINMLAGTPTIVGSLTTLGTLDLRGTPTISYRGASPALTTIWQPQTSDIELIAYFEK